MINNTNFPLYPNPGARAYYDQPLLQLNMYFFIHFQFVIKLRLSQVCHCAKCIVAGVDEVGLGVYLIHVYFCFSAL